MKKQRHNQRGMTIIEVLIALFIISTMLVLYFSTLSSIHLSRKLKYENYAYHSANKKMEELRASSFTNLPTSGSFTDVQFSSIPQASGTYEINNVPGFSGLKEIIVIVSWNDGVSKSVTLKTLAGSGGINPD